MFLNSKKNFLKSYLNTVTDTKKNLMLSKINIKQKGIILKSKNIIFDLYILSRDFQIKGLWLKGRKIK